MHHHRQEPYYAVIFKSTRTAGDNGYAAAAQKVLQEARQQDGFLGADSVRGQDGTGITVSYWATRESIETWKQNLSHAQAKDEGKRCWYADYSLRICKVEFDHFFAAP